jgi:hypothetical protein
MAWTVAVSALRLRGFVGDYSGGTVPDSHRVPFSIPFMEFLKDE